MNDVKTQIQKQQQVISPELHSLLNQHFSSDDILEDPNFDAIAYLNEKFPDFESLDKLPAFISEWEKEYAEIDEELDNLMLERAKYSVEMKNHMSELNNDVNKIVSLINSIKKSADINETTVKAICNDIKNLDNARNNITTTISSLTKLIILITGIESLEKSVKSKDYKEAANQIEACNDILKYFQEYKHITQIHQLHTKKENLCASLTASILQEFKNNIHQLPANEETLYNACLGVNAIGEPALNNLRNWFIHFKLMPYEEVFDPKKESDRVELSDTERRFEWIKRILVEFNNKYESIFPPSWGIKHSLCQEFFRITKLHLNEILSSSFDEQGKKLSIDVDILVKVLNSTISFENDMNNYLVNEYEQLIQILEEINAQNAINNTNNMENIMTDNSSSNYNHIKNNLLSMNRTTSNQSTTKSFANIDEIKARYEDSSQQSTPFASFFKKRQDPNKEPVYEVLRIKGIISECFEPYMICYVNIEEKKLYDIIDNLKFNDKIEGKLQISSLLLFKNIQQAIHRCLSFSKSRTFFDLALIFNKVFQYYNNEILIAKSRPYRSYNDVLWISKNIDSKASNLNTQIENEKKLLSLVMLESQDIKSICIMTNTCDYCSSTIATMTDSIKDKIDEKFKESISFEDSENLLKESYKRGIDIFFVYLKNICLDNMKIISQSNWIDVDPSNASPYVSRIREKISNFIKIVKEDLYENFSIHLLNLLPKIISDSFLYYFYRIKKIDETGAQQLLMDVFDLKSLIIESYKDITGKPSESDFNFNW